METTNLIKHAEERKYVDFEAAAKEILAQKLKENERYKETVSKIAVAEGKSPEVEPAEPANEPVDEPADTDTDTE